jgi:putative lipase involved disintegration of autophagic bodies
MWQPLSSDRITYLLVLNEHMVKQAVNRKIKLDSDRVKDKFTLEYEQAYQLCIAAQEVVYYRLLQDVDSIIPNIEETLYPNKTLKVIEIQAQLNQIDTQTKQQKTRNKFPDSLYKWILSTSINDRKLAEKG